MKRLTYLVVASLPLFFIVRCGSDSGSTDNSAIPQLAIASPMAANTRLSLQEGETVTDIKTFSKAKEELKEILAMDKPTSCFAGLGFKTFSKNVNCYGPELVVKGDPAGTGTACNPAATGSDYCLPGGDLGLWEATEGPTEACAAAKANQLVGDVAETINKALKFMAAMTCVSKLSGKALPAAGESFDLKADVTAAFTGATVTTATMTRKPDYTGTTDPVYELVLEASVGGKNFKVTLVNSFTSADKFRGRIYGYHAVGGSGPTGIRGFSAVFEQTSTTDLRVISRAGTTPTGPGTSTLFTADGDYSFSNFTGTGGSGDARYLTINLDPSTGLGTMKFAWQAGSGDAKTRVFHATTSRSRDSRADSGFAYFGFGPEIDDAAVGDLGGMICKWTGPGNTSGAYSHAGQVQAQSFSRTDATSPFGAVATHILFAPTANCNHTDDDTFKYGTRSQWNAGGGSGASVGDANVPAHALQVIGFLGTIPTVTAPTFAP